MSSSCESSDGGGPGGENGAQSILLSGPLMSRFSPADDWISGQICWDVSRHNIDCAAVYYLWKISFRTLWNNHPASADTRPMASSVMSMEVSTHLLLYSSLSLLTLASTLYRALSSGVMVSIWTPTPSGCVHVTPGPCRVSKRSPCLRTWVKLQMVPGSLDSGPSVCTATSRE